MEEYLKVDPPQVWQVQNTNGQPIHVFEIPTPDSRIVGLHKEGDVVTVIGRSGKWLHVRNSGLYGVNGDAWILAFQPNDPNRTLEASFGALHLAPAPLMDFNALQPMEYFPLQTTQVVAAPPIEYIPIPQPQIEFLQVPYQPQPQYQPPIEYVPMQPLPQVPPPLLKDRNQPPAPPPPPMIQEQRRERASFSEEVLHPLFFQPCISYADARKPVPAAGKAAVGRRGGGARGPHCRSAHREGSPRELRAQRGDRRATPENGSESRSSVFTAQPSWALLSPCAQQGSIKPSGLNPKAEECFSVRLSSTLISGPRSGGADTPSPSREKNRAGGRRRVAGPRPPARIAGGGEGSAGHGGEDGRQGGAPVRFTSLLILHRYSFYIVLYFGLYRSSLLSRRRRSRACRNG